MKTLFNIRSGNLPIVSSGYAPYLESDEICHLATSAIFWKVSTRGKNPQEGTLLATSRKLRFLSLVHGGVEIAWRNVMRVTQDSQGINLELTTRRGNGEYTLADPQMTEAIITTLARVAKRNVLLNEDNMKSRHIPHEVKSEVWQRDQGRCVQCSSSTYLEFDHIIPHSKGGANTVKNIQLLCRKCNSMKGNRI